MFKDLLPPFACSSQNLLFAFWGLIKSSQWFFGHNEWLFTCSVGLTRIEATYDSDEGKSQLLEVSIISFWWQRSCSATLLCELLYRTFIPLWQNYTFNINPLFVKSAAWRSEQKYGRCLGFSGELLGSLMTVNLDSCFHSVLKKASCTFWWQFTKSRHSSSSMI